MFRETKGSEAYDLTAKTVANAENTTILIRKMPPWLKSARSSPKVSWRKFLRKNSQLFASRSD